MILTSKTAQPLFHPFYCGRIFRSLLLCAATQFSPHATAQTPSAQDNSVINNYENWYQIELVIFKRAEQNTADKEIWPKNIALGYPANLQHLIDPTIALLDLDNAALAPTTEEQHPNADETLLELEEALPTQALAFEDDAPTAENDTPENAMIKEGDYSAEIAPFELLEQHAYILENIAYPLQAENGLSILFHQSWRQPINAEESAPAIVINGGEQFGEHHELEGTVTFSRSRYLHIKSDLWLTQFTANYGQESEHWPELPSIPKRITTDPLDITLTLDAPTGIAPPNITGGLIGGMSNTDFSLDLNAGTILDSDSRMTALLNDFSNLTDQPFLVQKIATFNQKRRMRSGELHLIDHPKLGVLVVVQPFTPEMLENESIEP